MSLFSSVGTRTIGLLAGLGFVLRIAFIYLRHQPEHFFWIYDEYLYYVSTAVNAFQGKGFFPEYNRVADGIFVPPPLQSLFVLGIFKLAGRMIDSSWVEMVQAAFGGLFVILCAGIGRRLTTPRGGVIMAFFAAIYPPFVVWPGFLMTEANFLFLLALTLFLFLKWLDEVKRKYLVAAALALGLLHLQRINALYLGPFLALWVFWKGPRQGRLANTAIVAFIPFLMLAPWLVRNLKVYGEPIVGNSNSGFVFFLANRLALDARERPYFESIIHEPPNGPYLPELEARYRQPDHKLNVTYYAYSKAYQSIAFHYILHNPLHFLRNYAWKFLNQFYLWQNLYYRQNLPILHETVSRTIHGLVLIGGVSGLVVLLAFRRTPQRIVILISFSYFALIGGLFPLTIDGRHNLYLRFFFLLFFASGLDMAFTRRRWRRG